MEIINSLFLYLRKLLFLFLWFVFTSIFANNETFADPAEGRLKNNAVIEINKETIQTTIESIKAREGLDDILKNKLLSAYQAAQDNLNASEKYKVQTVDFKKTIKVAQDRTKRLLKENELNQQRLSKQKLEDINKISPDELEQRLLIEKGRVTTIDELAKKKETDLVLQNSRPQLIREEIVAANQEIDDAQKELEGINSELSSQIEKDAKIFQLRTYMDAKTAELKMLDAEAISNPARVALLKAEVQQLEMQKKELSPLISAIEGLLSERRQQEAKEVQDALSQAEKELSGKHPIIQEITRENINYSRDLQKITDNIELYTDQKKGFDEEAAEISNDYKSAEKKIELAGLSPALGRILREQRRNIANRYRAAQQTESIQEETASTSLEQLGVEEKLKQLTDIDAQLKEKMRLKVDQSLPLDQRMMIQAEMRVLLNKQKELLNKLSLSYATYLRTLGDFDFARQQLLALGAKFVGFLDERLLWVPSSAPIGATYLIGLYQSAQWLLSLNNWQGLMHDVVRIVLNKLFLVIFALIALFMLLIGKRWAKQQLILASQKVGKIYTDNFYTTLRALAYSIALDLPAPILIYSSGWLLCSDFHASDFSKALGEGLQGASIPLFIVQFFYRLFAQDGIAVKHFHWQSSNAALMRRQFAWIRFIAVPGIFIIHCTGASKISLYGDSLGRLALISIMAALAIFLGRLFKPNDGLLQNHINSHPQGRLNRLRYVWYPALIIMPLIIIGFAIAGYYLSALELQQKVIVTLRLSFLLMILYELVIRWLTLVNRQLALKNARQMRKAAMQSDKQVMVGGDEAPVLPVEEQLIDIPKINAQTIRLLNVLIGFSAFIGFWLIWKNILPAFSFIERIVLWQHLTVVDNQNIYQPITLANLLLAGLYGFILIVSVRNFSGVMELLVFRRLSIEAAGRYAVNQLAKYFLITIGFICIANELGGSWSQVQWLVAALSVGLGFGLQEIFANLVSGIILLFERPVRIGDTVTIGGATGKVSRVQMRATTLIDWDQKELIIPNKTFITSQLVNWSLSDPVTRIVIPVGIAYGTDVELAYKVMVDTVKETPMVLAEPAPSVFFIGFGESSLDFSIRIFVSELSNRLPATHNVHLRLEKAFRENNIEIPFPQRDVHLRSTDLQSSAFGSDGLKVATVNFPQN